MIFKETAGGTEGFPVPLRRVVGKWNTCNLVRRAKFSNILTQDIPSCYDTTLFFVVAFLKFSAAM